MVNIMGKITIKRTTIELEMPIELLKHVDTSTGAIPRNFFICDILRKVLQKRSSDNDSSGVNIAPREG